MDHEGRIVKKLVVSNKEVWRTVPPSTIAVSGGVVFVGSTSCQSVLLRMALQTTSRQDGDKDIVDEEMGALGDV